MTNSYNLNSGNNYPASNIRKIELQNAHEQVQLKEQNEHEVKMTELMCQNEQTLKEKNYKHEQATINLNLGWFGRCFGSKDNASRNITGVICLTFIIGATLISLLVYFIKDDLTFIKHMWGIVSPIITLSLGYLFGKK